MFFCGAKIVHFFEKLYHSHQKMLVRVEKSNRRLEKKIEQAICWPDSSFWRIHSGRYLPDNNGISGLVNSQF